MTTIDDKRFLSYQLMPDGTYALQVTAAPGSNLKAAETFALKGSAGLGLKPHYRFSGDPDTLTIPQNDALKFGTGDGTILVCFRVPADYNGTDKIRVYSIWANSDNNIDFGIGGGELRCLFEIGAAFPLSAIAAFAPVPGSIYTIAVSFVNGVSNAMYINGQAVTLTTDIHTAANLDVNQDFTLFKESTSYDKGDLFWLQQFNTALSATEIASLSAREPISAEYRGATNTETTSGTLTVGKHYTITDFQAGDDFTNIGAASNETGVKFIATGTTPTTWTNSSGVTDTGNTLNLDSFGPDMALDSGHPTILATITGASLENMLVGAVAMYKITANDDIGPLAIIPAGWELILIDANETGGVARTLNYGTTLAGSEISPGVSVLANDNTTTNLGIIYYAATNIYVDFTVGGGSAAVDFTIMIRKMQ